jgi:hypothetical protein
MGDNTFGKSGFSAINGLKLASTNLTFNLAERKGGKNGNSE